MTTDGIQQLGGDADLIDGALRGSRSKEDGYQVEEEEPQNEVEEDDEDDEEDSTVLELGLQNSNQRVEEDEDSPPALEDLKAKAAREWEKEIGSVEVIDDPVRMYLREIGRVDLLKAPQERDLARKFEAKRYVETLEEDLREESEPYAKSQRIVGQMLQKVGDSEGIIKAILVSKEVPFDGTLPDLMANPDIRAALDGIFQDDALAQISAILSELSDEDPPDTCLLYTSPRPRDS